MRFTEAERECIERAVALGSQKNLSEFVRVSLLKAADSLLNQSALEAFKPFIGVVSVDGDFGRNHKQTYEELLVEKHGRRFQVPSEQVHPEQHVSPDAPDA